DGRVSDCPNPSRKRMSFFFTSKRRHTRWPRDWSSDVCSSDLAPPACRQAAPPAPRAPRRAGGAACRQAGGAVLLLCGERGRDRRVRALSPRRGRGRVVAARPGIGERPRRMSGVDTAASRQTIVRNTFWYGVVTAIGLVA